MDEVDREWVTFTRLDDADLVRLVGEIDLVNAPEIGRRIDAQMRSARAVVVDLTAVSFLDSAGVRLLDTLVGHLDDRHTPVRLVVSATGAVRTVLRLCAFREDLLDGDLAAAVDAVRR